MIEFICPHCNDKTDKKIDERLFSKERIQNSDDLNADSKSNLKNKIELWYCFGCGKYFRAYYKLEKLTKLNEEI